LIGLDLGSQFIKACSIIPKNDGTYIVYASMVSAELPSGNKSVAVGMRNKIKKLTDQLKVSSNDTVLSAGGTDLIFRDFSFPDSLTGKDLRKAIKADAQNGISEKLDNLYYDYQPLPVSSGENTDFIFTAFPKKIIDQMISNLSLAELNIKGVGVDNIALANSFTAFNTQKALNSVVVVDIGHETSKIVVINNGKPIFMKNAAFGGKFVTQEIANVYGISYYEAEQIKRQPEIWNNIGLNIKTILKKSSGNLFEAVSQSIAHCVSKQKISKIDEIFITGGGSILKGINGFMWETLGISTVKWNPFETDRIKGVFTVEKGFFMPVVLGLALNKEIANV